MPQCRWIGAIVFSLLLIASSASAQVKFTTFTSEHGRFTVLMPGTPEQITQVNNDPKLSAPYKLYMFKGVAGKLLFLVGYADYPADFNPNIDSELNANQVNFNKNVKGELIVSKRTDFRRGADDLLPALEFTSATATYNFKSTVIWEGPRLYQIIAGSPKGTDATRDIERFLASLVLKRPN